MRDHTNFDVSLFNKYVHDPNKMIYYIVIYVEHEGEFRVELVCTLD
jgi:hypothetical protein